MHRINRYVEKGQHWRTPLCIEKEGDKNPLFVIQFFCIRIEQFYPLYKILAED